MLGLHRTSVTSGAPLQSGDCVIVHIADLKVFGHVFYPWCSAPRQRYEWSASAIRAALSKILLQSPRTVWQTLRENSASSS